MCASEAETGRPVMRTLRILGYHEAEVLYMGELEQLSLDDCLLLFASQWRTRCMSYWLPIFLHLALQLQEQTHNKMYEKTTQ